MGPAGLSYGAPNRGHLVGGVELPKRGPGYVLLRPTDRTRFGLPALVSLVQRAAADVAARHPGAAPLRVADLSSPRGGKHSRHASHRTGRDVDLLFYVTDASGRPAGNGGWPSIDRFGLVHIRGAGADGDAASSAAGAPRFFDTARNWSLVRALLSDPEVPLRWIFCSRGIKARLLRFAASHERDADLLARAATILHQPSRGRPHDDHFHVRIACNAQQRSGGCRDYGDPWVWDRAVADPIAASPALDDATLVQLIMKPIGDEPAPAAPAQPAQPAGAI